MGAEIRQLTISGADFDTAWKHAVEEDVHELGHDYYAGSIRTINQFEFVEEFNDRNIDKHCAQIKCLKKPVGNTNKIKSEVIRYPQKGTRKWKTKYVVYEADFWQTKEEGSFDTQADAINFARNRSSKDKKSYNVCIEKRLESDNTVAEVHYKKSSTEKDGQWQILACVPC